MRPLKIVITGFESYKEKTEINFEELGKNGLYLITGDTGAGKTTIFDAITFALYGSPSGTDRNVEMLRSHFADENTPTVIELDFEAKGKKYHITRNPDYERKALRGEGLTKEAANAVLSFISEKREPVSGVSKVNEEVEKILNLKKDQFCRIAMIAQGSFQKLLLSKKDEKEKIFRELFHTEKYELLQNKLKTDRSEADQKLKDLNLRLHEALSRIEVDEKDENFEKINQIKTSGYVSQEEIELLRAFVLKDEKLLHEIVEQITDVEKKIEKTNSELQIGENRKNLLEQISASEKIKNEKEKAGLIFEKNLKETEETVKVIPDLEKEKNLLEASLKDYKEIEDKETEIKMLNREISKAETEIQELEQNKKELSEKSVILKNEQNLLKNAGENAGKLESVLEKIKEQQTDLIEIKNQLAELESEKKELIKVQEKAKNEIQAFDEKNQIYAEKLKLFNLEQAGILAEGLIEGCECPVCGSKNHPKLAVKSQNAPTQQELENEKKIVDKLQQSSSRISVEAGQKKTAIEKSEEAIDKMLKKYFESLCASDEKVLDEIERKKTELEINKKETEINIQKEKKEKARREEIDNILPEIETESKNIDSKLSKLNAELSGNKAKFEVENKNLAEKRNGLKYETLNAAQNQFNNLGKQISLLKEKLEQARNDKANNEKEIEKINGGIEKLKIQLESLKSVDIEKIKGKKEDLQTLKEELNIQRDALNERKGLNGESVATVEKLVPEIKDAVNRFNMISSLSEVAAGSSRGKNGKPSLETFVQMHCLDQINRRANLRLKTMTENKYELKRRVEEDGAELGLDLNVKDFYTGRERNVQTLSGGEQFQASLALALGLADEVQENSGGIKLETMFIDEGFGTLDPETLNKAMKALEELSNTNRLIGIISHVEELENRISKKICVAKDQNGVSHAKILID